MRRWVRPRAAIKPEDSKRARWRRQSVRVLSLRYAVQVDPIRRPKPRCLGREGETAEIRAQGVLEDRLKAAGAAGAPRCLRERVRRPRRSLVDGRQRRSPVTRYAARSSARVRASINVSIATGRPCRALMCGASSSRSFFWRRVRARATVGSYWATLLDWKVSTSSMAPISGHRLARGRDQKPFDVRRRELLKPWHTERDPGHGPGQSGELHRLRLLGQGTRDDHPWRVVRQHARSRDAGCNDELEVRHGERARDPIEQCARGVSAPRTDAVARGKARAPKGRREASSTRSRRRRGRGATSRSTWRPAIRGKDVRDERRTVERRGVVRFERTQPTGARSHGMASVIELTRQSRAELADDQGLLGTRCSAPRTRSSSASADPGSRLTLSSGFASGVIIARSVRAASSLAPDVA